MRWTPGGIGSDVEDRRGQSGGFGGIGGGGIGCAGFIILLIISLITGRNYIGAYLFGGGAAQIQQAGPSSPRAVSPQEDRSAQLASFVATDTQNTWTKILAQENIQYPRAKVVLFRDYTQSGCGLAQSATGPFYCPADQKVYLDLASGMSSAASVPPATLLRPTLSLMKSATTCRTCSASSVRCAPFSVKIPAPRTSSPS
jgi:uncharacterized protein